MLKMLPRIAYPHFISLKILNSEIFYRIFGGWRNYPRTILTGEEHECEAHFIATLFRTPSGRYGVRLPFKNSDLISNLGLSESYYPAMRMLSHGRTFQTRSQTEISIQRFHE